MSRSTAGWQSILRGDGGYVAIAPANPNRVYAELTGLSLTRATNGVSLGTVTWGIT